MSRKLARREDPNRPCFVYELVEKETGWVIYVGKAFQPADRWRAHDLKTGPQLNAYKQLRSFKTSRAQAARKRVREGEE